MSVATRQAKLLREEPSRAEEEEDPTGRFRSFALEVTSLLQALWYMGANAGSAPRDTKKAESSKPLFSGQSWLIRWCKLHFLMCCH